VRRVFLRFGQGCFGLLFHALQVGFQDAFGWIAVTCHFEANSPEDAQKLASALNWHETTEGTKIRNRRSTLAGEKGFGLGVCGTWDFFEDVAGRSGK
jgi:hypothetical protein